MSPGTEVLAADALPPVICDYLAASERGDVGAIVACFAPDGLVVDEDRTWRGAAEIRQWRGSVATAYEYTTELIGAKTLGEADGVARIDVYTHLEGNFPGGKVDLTDHFAVRGGRIVRLEIRPDRGRSVTGPGPGRAPLPGQFGIWVNPSYDDEARTRFVIEAEALGYPAAWLGFGRQPASDLALVERILKATSAITVATAILNMWTNDPRQVAASYRRVAAVHGDRFLLGIGIGHPESVTGYRQPYATMVDYLDQLNAGGVPAQRRILAALGPKALRLAADRTAGTHPYLVVPDHTRLPATCSDQELSSPPNIRWSSAPIRLPRAPSDAPSCRPLPETVNYTSNLKRYGYTDADITGGGSDRLIDALVLHGSPETVAAGLQDHLDAGADHVAIQALTPGDLDPMLAYRQLARVLL